MIVELPTNDDERGQVGIGTLIIFIAMVLVAAVAAGVLINTAGLLEATASDTSADSQAQVSNQIAVVSAVGNVDNATVQTLNFTLMKSAGSGDISLQNATVHYQSGNASETLNYGTTADANTFTLYNTSGGSPIDYDAWQDTTLSETDERIVLSLDLSNSAINDKLAYAVVVTVRFADQPGVATTYRDDELDFCFRVIDDFTEMSFAVMAEWIQHGERSDYGL
jgi:flagellin-like protein